MAPQIWPVLLGLLLSSRGGENRGGRGEIGNALPPASQPQYASQPPYLNSSQPRPTSRPQPTWSTFQPQSTYRPQPSSQSPSPTKPLWQPAVGAPWQIILNSTIDLKSSTLEPRNVNIFEVDLFDTPKATIDELHNRGIKVICYFSGGTSEDWRPDFASFPNADKGSCLPMWVGERYVDIRRPGIWEVMKARIRLSAEKGCDAIDPDNIDVYANRNGLRPSLTKAETVTFFKRLAREAASHGISIGLKNAESMLRDVKDYIQFAVNESCVATGRCSRYSDFLSPPASGRYRTGRSEQKIGKPVFHIEYTAESMRGGPVKRNVSSTEAQSQRISRSRQCLEGNRLGKLLSTTIKAVNLDGWVQYCDGRTAITALEKGLVIKGLAKECKGGR